MFGGHRLPGVAFETLLPPAPEALPRMDVALFAGFAEMGPVHRPVAIDDVAGYRRIFGGDLVLSRDPDSGETISAALAPTVRAFFSNGGVRCWVIRIARTAALEARWRGMTPAEAEAAPGVAAAGGFTLPGLLARAPGSDLELALHLARAQARSLGSWSDRLTVAARAERVPFAIADVTPSPIGFTADRPLAAGALVELTDALGLVYARVNGVADRKVSATWLASFAPGPALGMPEPVTVEALDGSEQHGASFEPETARLVFGDRPAFAAADRWLKVTRPGGNLVFLAEAVAGDAVIGRAWLPGPERAPLAAARAAEVTLGLRVDDGLGDTRAVAGIGLTPERAGNWWTNLPDDALAREATPSGLLLARTEADAAAPPLVWLPLGLKGIFSSAAKAIDDGRTALERDGLSRFDETLFLDPELATVRSNRILGEAERILYVDERPLFGVHGGFGVADGANFNPVSLIAVPDAIQPGWTERAQETMPPPEADAPPPAHWFDHRGPCVAIPKGSEDADAPDRSRFLDCATRLLDAPAFEPIDSPLAPGPVTLRWSAAGPGAHYVLEVASLADFRGAEPIYQGSATSHVFQARSEGFYYFRLRAGLDDEVSAPAAIGFAVRAAAWDGIAAADYSAAPLLAIQRAVMRMAAGSGEMFALLSLPRHYHAAEAIDHGRRLAQWRQGGFGDADMFDTNERRTLSFAALHHPWVVYRGSDGAARAAPPDGAVAGVHARRTLARGAWIAAANEQLRDIVALSPAIGDGDWPALDAGRINFLRRDARGFLLLDADTLSDEPEWRQINVRRLMSLLRRAAIRRGSAYVFEPNGDVLRRAVERGFTQMLEQMFRLGAFVGRKAEEAFRLAVDPTAADRDAGRLIVEIGVAPAQPMRFLTVRLAQTGERFTIAEES
ncbi:MAG TPA: phage tail sheath C-terminal domain-containing protein [Allosphingosinicella sp.]|nr:phage tail sheath C-terminal domain-containing protein [Allosphingosinicella sp.]